MTIATDIAVQPRLSVIIPSRNDLASLPRAVSSALALPLDRFEVIVIDDGSTDGTWEWLAAEAARDPRIVPVRRRADHGVSAARNAGIALARAPLVGFLDADDVWLAGRIAERVRWHESQPDATMSFSDFATLLTDGRLQDRYQAYWPRFRRFVQARSGMIPLGNAGFGLLVGENPVCTSSVIARSLAVRQAGGFDARLRQAEDWDLWIRLTAAGPVATSTVIEVYHAARPDSLSQNVAERVASLREVVRRHSHQAWRRAPTAALSAQCMLAQAEAELAQREGHATTALLHSFAAALLRPSVKLLRDAARAALVAVGLKPPMPVNV